MSVKVGKYTYQKSTRKDKKLMTEVDGKVIHFGDSKMDQFHDKTGIWSKADHGDKERREKYLKRASAIKDRDGKLTKDDQTSANYHSINVLW